MVDRASVMTPAMSASVWMVRPFAPKAVAQIAKSGLVSCVAAWYGRPGYPEDDKK